MAARRKAALRAVDRAYEALRGAIVAGRYAPARRITEHEAAAVAGVSRTPAREALRRLEAEGLVEFTPNHGAVVTAWSAEEADELFELRALLEAHAARRAALRASAAQRAELEDLAEQQRRESARRTPDARRIGELNRRFHHGLTRAAASPALARSLGSLLEATLIARGSVGVAAAQLKASAAQHQELTRALAARDPEWAAAVMRAHVLASRQAAGERGGGARIADAPIRHRKP